MARPLIGLNSDVMEPSSGRPAIFVNRAYAEAVHEAGGAPLILPNIPDRECLERIFSLLDGFLFVGGKDYPSELYGERPSDKLDPMRESRHKTDLILAGLALRSEIPIVGVCAGCQLLNIASGGRLVQHLENSAAHTNETYHPMRIEPGTRLRDIFGSEEIEVNSSHHQACSTDALGAGLRAVAFAPDGTIEAIEAEGERFLVGVQWHPERIKHLGIKKAFFRRLVDEARKHSRNK